MSFEPIRQLDIENYGGIKQASFAQERKKQLGDMGPRLV